MVLLPSRQVHVVPLGLYWESKDGWTPRICGDPAEKTRVGAKENKNSKGSMKENWMHCQWVDLKSALDVEALWVFIVICYKAPFFPDLFTSTSHLFYECHNTQKPPFLMILISFQSRSFSLYPVTGVAVLPQSIAGLHFKRCVNLLHFPTGHYVASMHLWT